MIGDDFQWRNDLQSLILDVDWHFLDDVEAKIHSVIVHPDQNYLNIQNVVVIPK